MSNSLPVRLNVRALLPHRHNSLIRAGDGKLIGTDYFGNRYYENNETAMYSESGAVHFVANAGTGRTHLRTARASSLQRQTFLLHM